jgi:hypothetical protein
MSQEQKYFELDRLSNSALSLFNYDPELYYKVYISKEIAKKESASLALGSLVHALILEPDEVNNRFILNKKPIENMLGTFIQYLANTEIVDEISQAAAYAAAGFKISLDKVLENFNKPESQAYYNFLKEANGKTVVSQEDYDKAVRLKDKALKVIQEFENTIPPFEVENEVEILWNYKAEDFEIPCKSKLDRLYRHTEKSLGCRYLDIKTDSQNTIYNYQESFEYWKTYRQLAFYTLAINEPTTHYILAINTKSEKVLLYQISQRYIVKGAREIHKDITDLQWHKKNNLWEYPKSVYDRLEMDKILVLLPNE